MVGEWIYGLISFLFPVEGGRRNDGRKRPEKNAYIEAIRGTQPDIHG